MSRHPPHPTTPGGTAETTETTAAGSAHDAPGPIDFVLLEFSSDRLTGEAGPALLDLVERGVIRLLDLLVVRKAEDGSVDVLELTDPLAESGGFAYFAGASSGLLGDDDVRQAAEAISPGMVAALIVYENTWAAPFVAAVRNSGGELVASARIPATDIIEAWTPSSRPTKENDMPGLLRGVARTAVVAGTATAVSGRVQRRQAAKYADRDAQIAADRSQAYEQDMAAQAPPPAYAAAPPAYAAEAPAPAPEPQADMIGQLRELAQLRDDGILTEEEFAAQKARLLA